MTRSLISKIRRECDVVLVVADARSPSTVFPFHPSSGQKAILILNKIDLCTDEEISALRGRYRGAIFMSARTRKGKGHLLHTLIRIAKEKGHLIRVGVVGVPNVGKSSIINLLRGKRSARTSPTPGETRGIQWLKLNKDILLYDSPGVFVRDTGEEALAHASTVAAEKMKDPESAAARLLAHIIKSRGRGHVAAHYDIEIGEGEDTYEILEKIAIRNGMLLKGGELDTDRAAKRVIHDWQTGKI
ncbi:MAG: 50S ribosome-binding GTPase [Candidatus Micrarchaeota archaeon]|nr:50S ribosome-binding GTPase [Candidatus Micrarchaeota archaeon]